MSDAQTISSALDRLILFRPGRGSLLCQAARAMEKGRPAQGAGLIISEAVRCGWEGNLWHCCLAQALAESENPFSLAWERRPAQRDSLWDIAAADMEVFSELFAQQPPLPALGDFHHRGKTPPKEQAGRCVQTLAESLAAAPDGEAMLEILARHYETNGVGSLGLGQVFRLREEKSGVSLLPVEGRRPVLLADLVGYEGQKAQLLENTKAFLSGQRANNVLLYGDAGTGKSTSVQAIAGEYASQGLRLIELYKHQFGLIPQLLAQIKGRNYRFILFLDDLSFEENEVQYKHLKAVMEGGGEAAPENVLIYATSNRRHLIRETWNDRSDMEHQGDVHRSDTMEEKLSLAGRFGLQIYYPNPTYEEYHRIVQTLADRNRSLSGMAEDELWAAASTWQVRHGSRSGRTAQQFINDLLCRRSNTETEED
ncbi:MAG: ATP-binding protein [Oscillospiraceae bacterium]|nr:ATP-binding protein [Oscillospiraceae bacterium]